LFDDPLSALDAKVARRIFEDVILKYLKGKTVILVTHQLQFLNQVDSIITLINGKVSSNSSFE
jgi:ABC-type transport system involved in cytochrome bd biosynthesis fused ATPase/permease subunit